MSEVALAELDPRGGVAAYRQIREILRGWILTEAEAGDRFPTDQALCQRFGVSRNTVRQAVDDLVREHLLLRIQGKGTFVRRPDPLERVVLTDYLRPWIKGVNGNRLVVEAVEVRAPDAALQTVFGLESGERVAYVKRRREVGGRVATVDHRYVPERFAEGINKARMASYSITDHLRSRGLEATAGEMEISTRPCSAEEAVDLGVEPGEVVLVRQITMQTLAGVVLMYGHSLYRLDFARLRFAVTS